jgi:DNA-binding SARP family transcriptional activator
VRKGIVPAPTRRERRLWAVLSTLALLAVVLAVPVLLYLMGGSPFTGWGVPHLTRAIAVHGSYDPHLVSHWLSRGALAIAWVSWAWMSVCVALEIRSWMTGRSPARLPGSRTMQSVAACLVGTALAFATFGRVAPDPRAPAAGADTMLVAPIPLRVIDDLEPSARWWESSVSTSDVALDGHASPGSAFPVGGQPEVGDGLVPGVRDDPPVGVESSPRVVEASVGPDAYEHVVGARETLWSIAGERLGSALRWKEIAQANYGVPQADGEALGAEHWIRPGWILQLPHSDRSGRSPSPARSAVAPSRSSDGVGSGEVVPVLDRPHGARVPSLPLTPVGAGMVGSGVAGLLDRMRRVQQRYRSGGMFIKLPSERQRNFEQRLRLDDGADVGRAVDSALRLFGQTGSGRVSDVPVVHGATVRPDEIELTTDTEGDAGLGPQVLRSDLFAVDPGGHRYRISRSALAVDRFAGRPRLSAVPPAPLMVSAGLGADGLVMVNLESLGSLVVNGDPLGCEGFVRALALELATSFWSDRFDLVLAGFGSELERFDRVVTTSDPSVLVDTVRRRHQVGVELLRATGHHSFARARWVEESREWDPMVVICGPALERAAVADVLGMASDPRVGIAAVAVGETDAATHSFSLAGPDGQHSSLRLLQSVASPQRVESEELEEIASLIETAGSRLSVLRSEEPYVNLPIPMPAAPKEGIRGRNGSAPSLEETEGGRQVEVLVLGTIEVHGAAREFSRAWARELVVYLAMHPKGASNEAWATALWPDRLMAPSSLHSTASVARRSLGQARDGTDHLPRSHGRLALGDTVGTDWDRFVALADSDDPTCWRSALGLVRGRPFEGIRSADWPIIEGIAPAIEATVVDLSGRLAGACLAAGDGRGAQQAARRGLLVSPYDERLYRMLMRAADLEGNPAGVEAVMAELVRLVVDDIEPLDTVHPATMDLYRSLTRSRTVAARLR